MILAGYDSGPTPLFPVEIKDALVSDGGWEPRLKNLTFIDDGTSQ